MHTAMACWNDERARRASGPGDADVGEAPPHPRRLTATDAVGAGNSSGVLTRGFALD
jgi:hypothetical protein